MKAKAIFLFFSLSALVTISQCQYYCANLTDVTQGQCCAGGKCCHDQGDHPTCCCDQSCFQYRDCCLDIEDIECYAPQGETLPDFCSIYSSLYTCQKKGLIDGCCVGPNCTVSSPSGTCCSCDKDCHIPSRQDCCPDINDIGCPCNNTCGAHYFSGCCAGGRENCHTTCPNYCYCDESCHNRGDCCPDIEEIGCRSPLTVPPPVVCTGENFMNLTWPETYANSTAYLPCPEKKIGLIYRSCGPTGTWNQSYVNDCKTATLNRDLDELARILNGHIRLTIEEQNKVVENATMNARNASSAPNTYLFPQDVAAIGNIVSDSIKILVRNLPQNESVSNRTLQEGLIDILNDLLDPRYEISWDELRNTPNEGGSNQLMENIEEYGRYSGQFLIINNNTIGEEEEELAYQTNRSNINMRVNIIKDDSKLYEFTSSVQDNVTESGSVNLKIPAEGLAFRGNGSRVAIVNSIVKNVGQFLTNNPTADSNVVTGSDVVTAQVYSDNEIIETGIIFNFTTKGFPNATGPRCLFWDYRKSNWSDKGVETMSVVQIATNPVQFRVSCKSNHTTPFVVLVDSQDVLSQISEEEYLALEAFTYIGVSISSICLVITIICLMMLGKELVTGVQFFIHFNLSIALLAGYLIYLFLIDNKMINVTNSKVACGIVAGFLHYFFLAAFSWMLCEGIMLFLLLVVVFSSISKRWYIFLVIGWGLPVLPVAISAGAIYDAYGVQGRFCWLDPNKRGAIWAFIGPMILIILVNVFFLVLSVRALFRYHSKNEKDKEGKKKGYGVFKSTIIGTVTLIPLLGVTWLIGVFSVNAQSTVFAWLFVMFASSQGILIFFINIVRNKKVQQTVINKCCPKLAKKRKNESVSRVYRHSVRERKMSRLSTQMSLSELPPIDDSFLERDTPGSNVGGSE